MEENKPALKPVNIVGLGGGLGNKSRSLSALKIALEAARVSGAETNLLWLGELNLPFFIPNRPIEEYNQAGLIKSYLDKIQAADGLIWASPVYHGSMSAAFKNSLDLLELLPRRPKLYLEGKVTGLIAVAGSQFTAPQAINAMWNCARALRTLVATTAVPVSNGRMLFDNEGNFQDEKITGMLKLLGREVTELARLYRLMPQIDPKRP